MDLLPSSGEGTLGTLERAIPIHCIRFVISKGSNWINTTHLKIGADSVPETQYSLENYQTMREVQKQIMLNEI
jgi:hypothetical protein